MFVGGGILVGVARNMNMMETNQKNNVGLTPLGRALIHIEQVLVEGNKPENFEDILNQIRKVETSQSKWVRGYAGAWRYQVK